VNDGTAVDIVAKGGELIHFVPANPVEMEYLITELSSLIEQMPGKLLELNEVRYAAERAYSRRKNTAMAQHAKNNSVTVARALAEVEALVELEELHNAKAAWHYADDTLKALTSKLYAQLNINKGVQAAYHSGGGRR
jgi:myo-inositol-1-phosphate synthase